jgi:hypothetical protein
MAATSGPAEGERATPARPPSARERLGELALEAALGTAGVVESRDDPLRGPLATALPDSRYGVSLHLVCRTVPLPLLADEVRRRVAGRARVAGLAEALGTIDITIDDLADGGDGVASDELPPAGEAGP